MADGFNDAMIVLLLMSSVLAAVALIELLYLRRRRKQGTQRPESEKELPDRAHNAILTAKAIRDTLARSGAESPEADDLIREAQDASRERKYRVAIELTDRAKAILRAAKLRQQQKGDLSKLDSIQAKGQPEDVTSKERLMKELPPNYAQSRFSLNLAREEIDAAKARGQDATGAEAVLAQAQASFDAQDYDAALKSAVRARRSLEGAPASTTPTPPAPPTPPPAVAANKRACPKCGSAVAPDDAFCRKCGTAMPKPRTCAACGSSVAPEDAFCRKCGAPMTPSAGNP